MTCVAVKYIMSQPNIVATKFASECLILGTELANERLAKSDVNEEFLAHTGEVRFGVLVLERAKLAVIVSPTGSTEEQIVEYISALSASIDDLDALNEM
jgi:hypothetical protein